MKSFKKGPQPFRTSEQWWSTPDHQPSPLEPRFPRLMAVDARLLAMVNERAWRSGGSWASVVVVMTRGDTRQPAPVRVPQPAVDERGRINVVEPQ
jgi:hypothetical protein